MLIYVGIILVILLFAGKLFDFPVAFMIIYGSSMKPNLESFDLVLGVWPSMVGGVGRGDVVVYCLPEDVCRSGCIVHRVIGMREVRGEWFIITKGDALENPDPPVSLSRVAYVVVFRLPRIIVLPIFFGVLGAGLVYYYIYLPYIVHRRRLLIHPGSIAILMIIFYSVFDLAYIGTGSLDSSPFSPTLPGIHSEELLFNTSSGTVKIMLRYDPKLIPLNLSMCNIVRPFKYVLKPELHNYRGYSVITMYLPRSVFQKLWDIDSKRVSTWSLPSPPARVSTSLWVKCMIRFDKGVLESTYPLSFNWVEPVVKQYNGSEIVVENKNPVPINVSLVVYSHIYDKIIYRGNIVLKPSTNNIIKTPITWKGDVLDVHIYYVFLGHLRGVEVSVHV